MCASTSSTRTLAHRKQCFLTCPFLFCVCLSLFLSFFFYFKLAARIVGQDTVKAAGAIRKIISSIEDHGIVDVFSRHDPRQIVASIYALSRLQAACQRYDRLHDSKIKNGSKEFTDRDLLQDICDAAPFATAAYGWKLDLATAGKIHRGDLRALTKMTGVKLNLNLHIWKIIPRYRVDHLRRGPLPLPPLPPPLP